MAWEAFPQSIPDWIEILDDTNTKFFLGLAFSWYAIERVVSIVKKIRNYGQIPFHKGYGVTSAMQCSMNMAIALMISVAVFEAVVNGAEFTGRALGVTQAQIVADAYTPLIITASLASLSLIISVYWSLFVRHRNHEAFKLDFRTKLARFRTMLKDRGVSDVEVLAIPAFSLGSTLFVWVGPHVLGLS